MYSYGCTLVMAVLYSWSGPYQEYTEDLCCVQVQLCSDDAIVVNEEFDESNSLTKHCKDGEFIWEIKFETELSIALDSSDLLYCATGDQVKVYLPSGAFSHVLVSDLNDPTAIAIDGDGNIHVGLVAENESMKKMSQ